MLEAALGRVLADATDAREEFTTTGPPIPAAAYAARKSFSKTAFNELRGACVSQGGRLTGEFLDLENEIDKFASKTQEIRPAPGDQMWVGVPGGLLDELDVIEAKARHLREEAVAGMERANAVIADTETEPPI